MKQKTLPGFTLLEMLLALALSGIVLSLGFGVYRLFVHYQQRHDIRSEESFAMLQTTQMLQGAFREANAVRWISSERISLEKQEQYWVGFEFRENELLRIQPGGSSDTLPVSGYWESLGPHQIYWVDSSHQTRHLFRLLPQGRVRATSSSNLISQP